MIKTTASEGQARNKASRLCSKITEEHLAKNAALYVRQSTPHQLREHQESTARQYSLKERLRALGWADDRIVVIDDDLGVSGSGKADRPGFRRLLKMVTDQEVGLVMGLEMSRLARNSRDWHDLFEVCAIFDTLIADEDGVFDPHDPNDRLVLGMKGILSELELHTMKVRLERGRLNKAKRGELFHDVCVGYVLNDAGLPEFDPDASARHAIATFFRFFESFGSARQVTLQLAAQGVKLPFRNRQGAIAWRVPGYSTVYELLKNPLYAGAYGYGRTTKYRGGGKKVKAKKYLPPEQWKVLLLDRFPAYITWQQYEDNQRQLRQNLRRPQTQGPSLGGASLLSRIVYCGVCGRRLSPQCQSSGQGTYHCGRPHPSPLTPCPNHIQRQALDDFVTAKVLEALAPAGLELSLRVIEDETARREQLETLHVHRVEQARYAAELAQRRYEQVDPGHRLVADSLEQQWEAALVQLQTTTAQLEELRNVQPTPLSERERQRLVTACADVAKLWRDSASAAARQQIVRLLIDRVEVEAPSESERARVTIRWSGGFESCHEIIRPVKSYQQLDAREALFDRILELALAGKCSTEIAAVLQSEGYRTPRSGKPISASMVMKLSQDPRLDQQLHDPKLEPDQWRSADLAKAIGVPDKRLKDWVTRGWATAIQRPFGRTWVIYADEAELSRLQELARSQSGQGRRAPPEALRTPASVDRKKQ